MAAKITNPTKSPTFLPKAEPKAKGKMNFGEAMQLIAKGKKVTKEEWKNKNWFAFLYKEDSTIALSDPDGEVHSWIISEGDIIGTDYVEV